MNKITEMHIFDLDGCLLDSSHRYRTDASGENIDLQYWIDNEDKAHLDTPIEKMCKVFRAIRNDATKYTLIATARLWCAGADSVVDNADIRPESLVHRKDRNDSRGGAFIKTSFVNRLLNLKQFSLVDTIHVYEDNYTYLMNMMDCYRLKGYNVVGHYIPSVQGH